MHSEEQNIKFAIILTTCIIVFVCLFTTKSAPLVNYDSTPFIVERISPSYFNKGMVKYYGKRDAANSNKPCRPCIVAPSRSYNIGDTIYVTSAENMRKLRNLSQGK